MRSAQATTHREQPLTLLTGHIDEFPESARHYLRDAWVRHHCGFFVNSKMWGVREKLQGRVANILKLPSTFVTMAIFGHKDEQVSDGTRIVGWVVYSLSGAIHYVYVRKTYRSGGAGHLLVATALRQQTTAVATHWSRKLPRDGAWQEAGVTIEYVGFDPIPTEYRRK